MRGEKLFRILSLGILLVLVPYTQSLQAQGFKDQFTDTLDNAFDLSQWMASVYGFVPIISVITEPAVGYGAGGALLFFHRRKEHLTRPAPPSISMIGGMYTESKSWGTFLLHQGIWKDDRIRYLGVAGYISLNMTLYREAPNLGEQSFDFNMKGAFLIQQMIFRLGETNFFAGGRYSFFKSTSTFLDEEAPIDPLELDTKTGALGPVLAFDRRDNTFTPNQGMYTKLSYGFYHEYFGSDFQFHRLDTYWTGFTRAADEFVLGLRADLRLSTSEAPFYAKPYVILRGIPAMRYQNDRVLVLETEERWDLTGRWSLVGFMGVGKAFLSAEDFSDRTLAYSVGGGFRYKIARLFKIYAGIDVARGNEDWAVYIQFGHYWNSL